MVITWMTSIVKRQGPRTWDNLRRNPKKFERGRLNNFPILENKESMIPMGGVGPKNIREEGYFTLNREGSARIPQRKIAKMQ